MKILFPYTGDSVGGSHMSSLMLADALMAKGFDVTIALHRSGGPLQDLLEARGTKWSALPDVNAPRLRARWRQVLRRREVRRILAPVLEAGAYDIVHTHDMRNHLIWSAATEGSSARHIWHQRTPASGHHMTTYGKAAAAFVAVSEFTRDSLPDALQPVAQVIYNPFVPQEPASEAARNTLCRELGVPAGTPVIGYVANFSDRKRPELFVEIAAKALAEAPELVFAMFGAPHEPHLSRVQARAQALGLSERLHILGQRSPFAPYMAGLTALVAPARDEALGRTLIEAGFSGVPLIATDEGGNREIVDPGTTGLLVAPDDVQGFADALLRSLRDPDATLARCIAARSRVSDRFSLQSHVASIEALYEKVMQ